MISDDYTYVSLTFSTVTVVFMASGIVTGSTNVKVASVIGLLLISSLAVMTTDNSVQRQVYINKGMTSVIPISLSLLMSTFMVIATQGGAASSIGAGTLSSSLSSLLTPLLAIGILMAGGHPRGLSGGLGLS